MHDTAEGCGFTGPGQTMKERLSFIIAICIVLGLSITFYFWHNHGGFVARRIAAPEKLTIAINSIPVSAPVWVAQDKGFFKDEGLDVTLQNFFSGKDALEFTLSGKSDIATCAETPIMQAVMAGRKLSIIATIATSERMTAVVVRKDKGITKPADLQGKKIGVMPYTTGDYLLATFLLFHGVPKSSVKIVTLNVDQMKEAMKDGRVDAVSTWEPHITDIRKALGASVEVYYATGFYRMTWDLVTQPDFISKRPETVKRILRALVKAEDFIGRHPEQAILIASTHLGMDKAELREVWESYYFQVSLDQSLLLALENQASWAMANKLVSNTIMPDFMESIHVDALRSVRPDTVTIIGAKP